MKIPIEISTELWWNINIKPFGISMKFSWNMYSNSWKFFSEFLHYFLEFPQNINESFLEYPRNIQVRKDFMDIPNYIFEFSWNSDSKHFMKIQCHSMEYLWNYHGISTNFPIEIFIGNIIRIICDLIYRNLMEYLRNFDELS